jgi:hypothetical protein
MATASKTDDFLFAPSEEAPGPQYLALRNRIAEGIARGRLAPGVRLPSERRAWHDPRSAGAARGRGAGLSP